MLDVCMGKKEKQKRLLIVPPFSAQYHLSTPRTREQLMLDLALKNEISQQISPFSPLPPSHQEHIFRLVQKVPGEQRRKI